MVSLYDTELPFLLLEDYGFIIPHIAHPLAIKTQRSHTYLSNNTLTTLQVRLLRSFTPRRGGKAQQARDGPQAQDSSRRWFRGVAAAGQEEKEKGSHSQGGRRRPRHGGFGW